MRFRGFGVDKRLRFALVTSLNFGDDSVVQFFAAGNAAAQPRSLGGLLIYISNRRTTTLGKLEVNTC